MPTSSDTAAASAIDVMLESHDHHADNLDPAGRVVLPRAAHVFTTNAGAERLGGRATGLDPWQTATVQRPNGDIVSVTALPALHGPEGCADVTGPVIGFLVRGQLCRPTSSPRAR